MRADSGGDRFGPGRATGSAGVTRVGCPSKFDHPLAEVGMEPKQVIVMRRDLGMRRGKEIAQGAHASMIWLSLRIRQPGYTFTEAERQWLSGPFTKVCVRVDSEEELHAIV